MPSDEKKEQPAFPEPARSAPASAPAAPRSSNAERAASRPSNAEPRSRRWLFVGLGAVALIAIVGSVLVVRSTKKGASARVALLDPDDDEDEEREEEARREKEKRARLRAAPRASSPPPPALTAPSTPAQTEVARLCACLKNLAEGPVVRAKCTDSLRDDTSPESKACLQAFLDDPETQKQLDGMKDEDPTPEQEVILNADNALRAKARLAKTLAAQTAPVPTGPASFASPQDSPKMKELKGPGPALSGSSAPAPADAPATAGPSK